MSTPAKLTPIQLTRDLLRVEDAAKLLHIHLATAYRWIGSGRIVGIMIGNTRYIPRSEVERLK